MPIEVPPQFATTIVEREGAAGRDWLAALPDLVDELLGRWSCSLDGDVTHGGVGIVVPVVRGGTDAVIKISFPHPGNAGEWAALACFGGRGAVRLHEVDPDSFAMLLERARTETLSHLGRTDEALSIAGRIAARLAVPAEPATPRLSELAGTLTDELLEQHRAARRELRLPDQVLDAAARTYQDLAGDTTGALIHGDLHFSNVLRADREPWLAIDPKGLAGTPCFDAATVVRHRLLDLVGSPGLADSLNHRVEVFSEAAGADHRLSLRCTQARFASSYYWELCHGSDPEAVDAMRAASLAATHCLS